jgi:ribosomal protein S18 acetylase RimI-like enzyme
MPILPATISDIPELLSLVNSAFRGETARKGWSHEADLLDGTQRTDAVTLAALLHTTDAVLLKYCNDAGVLEGCVFLHKKERGIYLGMLTVNPELQGGGIGKKLLAAADGFALQQGAPVIFMTVFSVRHELIAWYERHGYYRTGETKPYEVNPDFGLPTRTLEFVILEKEIGR